MIPAVADFTMSCLESNVLKTAAE